MIEPTINLYNQDCMVAMASMPDKAFDLAIVDPPYGIGDFEQGVGKQKKEKKWEIKWNDKIPSKEYFIELHRISKEQIIWGANYYNCFSGGHGAIIWDKSVTHPDMSKAEIASVSHYKKVEIAKIEWNGFLRCGGEKSIHPCMKPSALYRWILRNYAKPNDKILDTHLGSGSIAIACYDMGYDLTGYEIDTEYFNAAVNRLENHKKQYWMF